MEITAVEVQRGLQEFYDAGEIGYKSPRVCKVTLLGSGYETDVFAFALKATGEGTETTQDLVLRIYAGEGAPEKAAREFAAMSRLRKAGYPVPEVLDFRCDRSPFDRPFLIMERIHGVSLGEVYWATLENRQQYQALLYRLMAQLHVLEGRDILPDSPLAGSRDPYGFVDHELMILSEMLNRLQGREAPSLREALDWLGSRRSTVPCERLAVVHGDFHPNNVLQCDDGIPFVIDWSNVRLADYRSDLAWTRLITRADDLPDGGETELRIYEQFAGKKVAMIEYFDAAACTRLLLSVLISLQFGSARQGMRPEAEALMRQDPDHTKYVAALLQKRTGIKMSDLDDALSSLFGKA